MEAAQPRTPRIGRSRLLVDHSVDSRLVRRVALLPATLLLAALLLMDSQPGPLPPPTLPPSFDSARAVAITRELARQHPSRVPGTSGALEATDWVREAFALVGLDSTVDEWVAEIPDLGPVSLRNVQVLVPGETDEIIAFVANRDNDGQGPGANDNASGTATLVELARAYAPGLEETQRAKPRHTLVFLSTDAGAYGHEGAARFAQQSPLRDRLRTVVALEGVAGRTRPRLEIAGDGSRSPSPALVETAAARLRELTEEEPRRPGLLRQLVDLAIPFAYGGQGPVLGSEISAVRITTADDSGRSDPLDDPRVLSGQRLAEMGTAAQALLDSLDEGAEVARGTSPYVRIGSRILEGRILAIVLLAALVPFAVGLADFVARLRRSRVPLAPAFRAMRSRLGLWLLVGLLLWAAGKLGVLPTGVDRPLPPSGASARDWPFAGLALLALPAVAAWLLARSRLAPRRPAAPDDGLAGVAAALVTLLGVAILTAVVNPYGLLFLLPSLYAWLLLPPVRRSWLRDLVYGIGLTGPVLLLVSLSARFDLGLDVVLYVLGLSTVGYVGWPVVLGALAWLAAAAQMGAVVSGRYAPYADGRQPPPGVVRRTTARLGRAAQGSRR